MAKEFFRLVRRESEHADVALRRTDKARDQIHERGLAGTVRSDQTCNPRRQSQVHAVHTQHFAVKLGDVFKNDAAVRGGHECSTSRARSLRSSSQKQAAHTDRSDAHAAQSGTALKAVGSSACRSRKRRIQTSVIMWVILSKLPHCVRKIAFRIAAAAGK